MADFDTDDLRTDLDNVVSPTYGGEAFKLGGGAVTYYGVFETVERGYSFLPLGQAQDDETRLIFTRGSVTPAVNATVLRIGESTTYRILDTKFDAQAWDCRLQTLR